MPKLEDLSVKEIRELRADDRGRVNLGQENADETHRIAILETDSE